MDAKSIELELTNCNLIEITAPHFIIDMMYARSDNMAGFAAYQEIGLGNRAFVHRHLYEKLIKLVPQLDAMQLKMRICDAYRPPLAHTILLKKVTLPGLFAANYQLSNHCHGTAIDVCLTDLNGKNLDYPTNIDAYTPQIYQALQNGESRPLQENLTKARHDFWNTSISALANRALLKDLMVQHGFQALPQEWWHYNLKGYERYPVIELNCFKTYQL